MHRQIDHVRLIRTSKAVRRLELNFSVQFEPQFGKNHWDKIKSLTWSLQLTLVSEGKPTLMEEDYKASPSPLAVVGGKKKKKDLWPLASASGLVSVIKWTWIHIELIKASWRLTVGKTLQFRREEGLCNMIVDVWVTSLLKTSTERLPQPALTLLQHVGHNHSGLANSTHQSNVKAWSYVEERCALKILIFL